MEANSRFVCSNQNGIHNKLQETVSKYLNSECRRPYAAHTRQAFEHAQGFVTEVARPVILDACCGTAQSTLHLALTHPEHCVIGVDKSLARLQKNSTTPANMLLLQADLLDFYRLAAAAGWQLDKHFLLYPNPWPKSSHLKRRWHAMPSFPAMLQLGGELEVRSNWQIYIEEFVEALRLAGFSSRTETFTPTQPITAFERKYLNSGHRFWRCRAQLWPA